MKILKSLLLTASCTLFLVGCKNENTPTTKTVEHEVEEKKQLNPDATYETAQFEIDGMKCALGCAKVIEKNIAGMDGVKEATVDFDTKTATVSYDIALQNQESLTKAVKESGETYEITSWSKDAAN